MKIYKITRTDEVGYDDYDSAIVAADSKDVAIRITPGWVNSYGGWPDNLELISVEYIGKAKKGTKTGVILASYNAG